MEKYKWLRDPTMFISRESLLRLSSQVSGGAMKGVIVPADNLLKTLEAMRTKDGHNLVRNHIPDPNLEKDERGLVNGMLTYKDVGPTADDLLRFADNWNQIAQEAERR